MSEPFTVELRIEPTQIAFAHLGQVMVGFVVHNAGVTTVDPGLATSVLRVGGVAQRAWTMALINSGHDARWTALPPGDRLTSRWRIGAALFPAPGTYAVDLTIGGVTSASIDVVVAP